jgi:hypothetical protein
VKPGGRRSGERAGPNEVECRLQPLRRARGGGGDHVEGVEGRRDELGSLAAGGPSPNRFRRLSSTDVQEEVRLRRVIPAVRMLSSVSSRLARDRTVPCDAPAATANALQLIRPSCRKGEISLPTRFHRARRHYRGSEFFESPFGQRPKLRKAKDDTVGFVDLSNVQSYAHRALWRRRRARNYHDFLL